MVDKYTLIQGLIFKTQVKRDVVTTYVATYIKQPITEWYRKWCNSIVYIVRYNRLLQEIFWQISNQYSQPSDGYIISYGIIKACPTIKVKLPNPVQ